LPNVIKIDPYNFELHRFKLGAFFLRHSVYVQDLALAFHVECLQRFFVTKSVIELLFY